MSQQELTWKASVDPQQAVAGMRQLAEEAKTSSASIEASVRQEAQAAIALQRQRSAALIAQWKADVAEAQKAEQQKVSDTEKAQAQSNAAVLALQRQRSAALLAQWKADTAAALSEENQRTVAAAKEEAQRNAAAASLQRQRSAALFSQLKAEALETEKTEKAKAAETLKNAAQAAASNIQLSHTVVDSSGLVEKAFDSLGEHLNLFVGERLPLVGGGFIRLTDNLRSLHIGLQPVEGSVLNLGKAIGELSGKSGKSVDDIKTFLESYVKLGSQAEKDTASINFFGAALAQNLSPALNRASTEMGALAAAGGEAGAGIGAIAAPVAIVVAALAALVAIEYELIKNSVEASNEFATFGGELGRAADQTKLTIEQLNGLKLLADENHISFEGLTLALGKYLRAVTEARQNPVGPIAENFQRLGIDVEQLGDDPVKAINALLAAFDRLGPSMKENQAAQALLSREGIKLITIFRETGGSLDELTKRGQQYRQITAADVEVAKQQEKTTADLAAAWQNLTLQYGKSASPEVTAFINELTNELLQNKDGILLVLHVLDLVAVHPVLEFLKNNLRALEGLAKAWSFLAENIDRASRAATIFALTGSPSAAAVAEAGSQETPAVSSPTQTPSVIVAPREPQTPLPSTVTAAQIEGLKALAEQTATITAKAIAEIDSSLKLGTISQQTATNQIIAALQKERDAKLDYLNAEIAQHQKLLSLVPDVVASQKEQNQIDALQQKALETRAKFENDALNKRTELQTRERAALIEHFTALVNIAIEGYQNQIVIAQRAYERGEIDQTTANKRIEAQEDKIFEARKTLLEKKIQLSGKESKKLVDELQALTVHRTTVDQTQADRRKQIALDEARTRAEIEESAAQSRLAVARVEGDSSIAQAQADAAAGVKTREQAAILTTGIVVKRINDEIKAEESRKKDLAKLYPKVDEREKAEAALNDQIAILEAERTAAIKAGVTAQAQARQEDIDRLNAYEEAYTRLTVHQLITDEEISKLRLELLRARNAPFLQILLAQLALEEEAENKRHASEESQITKARNEALQRVKGVQDEDAKRLQIQKQFDLDMEKEKQRHNAAMGLLREKGGDGDGDLDSKKAGLILFRGSNPFIEAQKVINQQFGEGTAKAQLFTAALGAVDQAAQATAQAVGQMTQQWILYGKAGDSFQKVAAQIIASLASQAIAQAAYQFASGLAWEALFWFTGDAQYQEAANFAFLAAAAFGAVGAVTAVAGRAIAGNAFAASSGTGGGGGSGSSGGSSGGSGGGSSSQGSSPITMGSQRGPDVLHIQFSNSVKSDGSLHTFVESAVLKSASGNGTIRKVIVKEINRQS